MNHNSWHTGQRYTVWDRKSSPPKTFCNIFTQVKCISVKFFQYVASLYLHILTNFGRFILIFNKMTLIFLGVPIVFNVFSFKFHQSNRRNFIANNEVVPSSSDLNALDYRALGWMLESYCKLQSKLKTVPKFTNALQLIWSALPEKAIDNAVKDNRSWLQACVSARVGNFEHVMWQFV